jgi:hypothetical protein
MVAAVAGVADPPTELWTRKNRRFGWSTQFGRRFVRSPHTHVYCTPRATRRFPGMELLRRPDVIGGEVDPDEVPGVRDRLQQGIADVARRVGEAIPPGLVRLVAVLEADR